MYLSRWICPACRQLFRVRCSGLRVVGAKNAKPEVTGARTEQRAVWLAQYLQAHPGASWDVVQPYVAGRDATARAALRLALSRGTVVCVRGSEGARYYAAGDVPAEASGEASPPLRMAVSQAACPRCGYSMQVTLEISTEPVAEPLPEGAADSDPGRVQRIAAVLVGYFLEQAKGAATDSSGVAIIRRTIEELKRVAKARRTDVRGALRLLDKQGLVRPLPGGPRGAVYWTWTGKHVDTQVPGVREYAS